MHNHIRCHANANNHDFPFHEFLGFLIRFLKLFSCSTSCLSRYFFSVFPIFFFSLSFLLIVRFHNCCLLMTSPKNLDFLFFPPKKTKKSNALLELLICYYWFLFSASLRIPNHIFFDIGHVYTFTYINSFNLIINITI